MRWLAVVAVFWWAQYTYNMLGFVTDEAIVNNTLTVKGAGAVSAAVTINNTAGNVTGSLVQMTNTETGGANFEELDSYSNDATGAKVKIVRGRGTNTVPASILVTDDVYDLNGFGLDTNFAVQRAALLTMSVDSTVVAGVIPGRFNFWLTDSSGALRQRFRVDSAGHLAAPVGAASPVATACGNNPVVVGSDVSGSVTIGATGSGCTVTWNGSYAVTNPSATPNCVIHCQNGGGATADPFQYSVSNTTLTLTQGTAGHIYSWICIGY